MSYRDSKGRRWQGRRPNGWPNDQKAPDGFTINGYRKVGKDGCFTLVGTRWQSPFRSGAMLYVWINDCWALEVCAVEVDSAKWNPDTLNDDWSGFIRHCHAVENPDQIQYINKEKQRGIAR